MSEKTPGARFVEAWARYSLELSAAQSAVNEHLSKEPAVFQEAQAIIQTTLATFAQRREVALRMALAEFQLYLEHE